MTKNTKITLLYLLGTALCFIMCLELFSVLRKKRGKRIEQNIGYAIGDYRGAFANAPRGSGVTVKINFVTYATVYIETTPKGKNRNYQKAKKGDRFLVIYDRLEPENCQILFDYPIKDSSDFKRYLEEFKVNPLNIDKYF